MAETTKLDTLKSILGITGTDEDATLTACLSIAEHSIIEQMYKFIGIPVGDDTPTVPDKYYTVHIEAASLVYSHMGAEGETTHNENGINRVFAYPDMIRYVRCHVMPIVRV